MLLTLASDADGSATPLPLQADHTGAAPSVNHVQSPCVSSQPVDGIGSPTTLGIVDGSDDLVEYARMPIPSLPPRAELARRTQVSPAALQAHQALPMLQRSNQAEDEFVPLNADGPDQGSFAQIDGHLPVPAFATDLDGHGGLGNMDHQFLNHDQAVASTSRSRLNGAYHDGPAQQRFFVRNLLGTPISSAYLCRDLEDELGIFFVLPDLSVREEGVYRLLLSLSALSHNSTASEGVTSLVTSKYTPQFGMSLFLRDVSLFSFLTEC